MTSVVVDASVAVKWVLDETYSPEAVALLQEWANAGMRVIAPALQAYELTNILHKRVGRADMTIDEAYVALTELLGADVTYEHDAATSLRALELAHQFGLPATYDAHYLALAEREGCEYWTADERLWNGVSGKLSWVRWIGAYHSPASDD